MLRGERYKGMESDAHGESKVLAIVVAKDELQR
jgi:hypothetical protein